MGISSATQTIVVISRRLVLIVIFLLYVDDILIVGAYLDEINMLKKQLSSKFEMKDLGITKQIIRMGIIRDKQMSTLWLS